MKLLNKIRKDLKPLMKFKKEIALIYVYGSAVSKKKYNDIDILVVYDDTESKKREFEVQLEIEKIGEKTKLGLHFQSLKIFSAWWRGVISGEGWIITSIKNSLVIYDKYNIIDKVSNMIKKEKVFLREEKADSLLEYSDKLDTENRELLLNSVSDLVDAATDACQVLLILNKNKIIINKKKIIKEIEGLKFGDSAEHYKNLVDWENKIKRGVLTEFSGENLDFYLYKVKQLILKVRKSIEK